VETLFTIAWNTQLFPLDEIYYILDVRTAVYRDVSRKVRTLAESAQCRREYAMPRGSQQFSDALVAPAAVTSAVHEHEISTANISRGALAGIFEARMPLIFEAGCDLRVIADEVVPRECRAVDFSC
jgi:hypothetical protein